MKSTTITLLTLTAAASFAQSAPAAASAFTTSGNLAYTSDYVWRGISQNAGDFAIQGGFDAAHSSGFSVGVWASNVSAGTSSVEVDLFANYGFKLGAFDASLGYINYAYIGNSGLDFTEINASLSYSGLQFKVSKGVSNTDDYYYEANYSYDIAAIKGLNLGLHYGDDRASAKGDFALALSYPVFGFTGTIAYSDLEDGDSITAVTLKRSF